MSCDRRIKNGVMDIIGIRQSKYSDDQYKRKGLNNLSFIGLQSDLPLLQHYARLQAKRIIIVI